MNKIFALILIFALYSCKKTADKKSQDNYFEITGVLNDSFQGYIYLTYANYIDSVLVKENKFRFEGKVANTIDGHLSLKRGAEQAHLYVENSSISLKADHDYRDYENEGKFPFISITDIKGSHSEKIIKDYADFYQKNQGKDNFHDLLYYKLDSLITENNDHPFSGGILANNAFMQPVLSKEQLINLYTKLDTTNQNKSDLSLFRRGMANLEKYPEGKQFIEFRLPNGKNEKVSINNKYGKITLIDFWASWCSPCRKVNPKYVALKNRLKSTNFDIISISIDDAREKWLKAIEMDKLEWTNLIDQKREVYNELDIIGIPYNYLVDENGIIIKINPGINEIEKVVREKASR